MAALVLLALAASTPAGAAADAAGLEARVAALESELQALKSELAALRNTPAPAPGPEQVASQDPAATPEPTARPAQSWFGYGELNYTRPSNDPAEARFDLSRFVVGLGYRFNERTRLQSELEIEHAVSSAGDPGEVEIEQAYIEHELGRSLRAKMGLFLIPSGLLNTNHEPTRYYGVFRNFVETAIIPSTWREGGVGLQGDTRGGLRWDVGLSTGFDLSRWDASASDGTESPLGAIHQELALARAADLSSYLAVDYLGRPGLRVGGSVFSGGAAQRQPGLSSNRVTLWETHARWQPGRWDFAALYAHGHISNTAAVNAGLLGMPTLIPENFYGWYGEAAWRGWRERRWPLTPFLRYERFNTAASYAMLAFGLTPPALPI
ncbi:MAG: hypothetical protein WCD08_14980, partial [Steroidobacteraceae bacterium]